MRNLILLYNEHIHEFKILRFLYAREHSIMLFDDGLSEMVEGTFIDNKRILIHQIPFQIVSACELPNLEMYMRNVNIYQNEEKDNRWKELI